MGAAGKLNLELQELNSLIDGELFCDPLHQALYATDASIYRKHPLGVVFPRHTKDIVTIVKFAYSKEIPIIPRTAGTSLAGQCVGEGLVMDVSKHMNQILEFDIEEKSVVVQPGVIRDELNAFLAPHGLHFGPNTSTANRCMIGGMVGNNSCGTSSIVYGSTRDHTLSLETVLSDGSIAHFSKQDHHKIQKGLNDKGLLGEIYRGLDHLLSSPQNQILIKDNYPKTEIKRRNTGYALDLIIDSLDMCHLLCGSEGTLAITTKIKLNLNELPPPHFNIVCAHFHTINDSMLATVVAMKHHPYACELMDKTILDCTKSHVKFNSYRWWVKGDPEGVLMIELRSETKEGLEQKTQALIEELNIDTNTFATPVLEAHHASEAWALRSAGLGLLANIPGEAKAVACIEDTAVALNDLPAFINEFELTMVKYEQQPIYYAHAGAGEIHLRPRLDLKSAQGRKDLYDITKDTAILVKKYKGSLSGEHGDGRVRAPFIPLVYGEEVYELLRQVKQLWDPKNILNPGKIVDAAPMDQDLRDLPNEHRREVATIFEFKNDGGFIGALELCNGSGDCRKLPASGGTMCPSYQATRNEKDSTRGRANVLREFLQKHPGDLTFSHPQLKEVMDLCLSCKGCTSECPSNVDMAKIKAEYQHQLYKENGIPWRTKMIAENYNLLKLGSYWPSLTNFIFKTNITSSILKRILNISKHRDIPLLHNITLRKWYSTNYNKIKPAKSIKTIVLFCDEFTDVLDTPIGIATIKLLSKLNYAVEIIEHSESGRAHISKGLLKKAKQHANKNTILFSSIVSEDKVLVGIEPSAILTFRDEYISLVDKSLKEDAITLAQQTFTIEEFLINEVELGNISREHFDQIPRHIFLHGHCHQKALGSIDSIAHLLSLPGGHTLEIIPSGCCGMAGSFGYEKDHFDVSMKIGELVLFPAIRKINPSSIIAAPGTSCRHQIFDGTGREAKHPVEILYSALID